MCLTKVDAEPRDTRNEGYKVLDFRGRSNIFQYKFRKRGWNHDSNELPLTFLPSRMERVEYPAGFHIFKTLTAAKVWAPINCDSAIYLVQYRNLVATGYQEVLDISVHRRRFRVVVARSIRFVRKVQ